MVIVVPLGAWPVGFSVSTRLNGPILFTLTLNPACSSRLRASFTFMLVTSGILTWGGPLETNTVTVSFWVIGGLAPGVCLVIVPCGWSLLASCWTFSWIPFWPAHCWMADTFWPTKLGSGGPSLTEIATGLVCGQRSPAAGEVLITMPASTEDEATLCTWPTVSPACRSACLASDSCWPLMSGTLSSRGPDDGTRVTIAPLCSLLPAVGGVRTPSPAGTVLLVTAPASWTAKPSCRSCSRAWLSVRPATAGTLVSARWVNHQPPAPAAASNSTPRTTHSPIVRPRPGPPGARCPAGWGQPSRWAMIVCPSALGGAAPVSTWVLYWLGSPYWPGGPPYPDQSPMATAPWVWPGQSPPSPRATSCTDRRYSLASAGRPAGSRLVACSTSRSTSGEIPPASRDGAGTDSLTCL